ncbi:MAG: hypothetical protein O7I42_19395 [Alphaproteobacteria bacterium]|nr:hypothetical protein [Alphaproteobacteria bacterium]
MIRLLNRRRLQLLFPLVLGAALLGPVSQATAKGGQVAWRIDLSKQGRVMTMTKGTGGTVLVIQEAQPLSIKGPVPLIVKAIDRRGRVSWTKTLLRNRNVNTCWAERPKVGDAVVLCGLGKSKRKANFRLWRIGAGGGKISTQPLRLPNLSVVGIVALPDKRLIIAGSRETKAGSGVSLPYVAVLGGNGRIERLQVLNNTVPITRTRRAYTAEDINDIAGGPSGGLAIVGTWKGSGPTDGPWNSGFVYRVPRVGDKITRLSFYRIGRSRLNAVLHRGDGGFIAVGSFRRSGRGAPNAWVVRLDKRNKVLWKHEIRMGSEPIWATTIAALPGGGFIVGGKGNVYAVGKAWVVAFDADGKEQWRWRSRSNTYSSVNNIVVPAPGMAVVSVSSFLVAIETK